jgi:hypothetical protein
MTDKLGKFTIGGRYAYITKDECYRVSIKAIEQGYQVRYGISYAGKYFFEIIDPFEGRYEQ